MNVTKDSFSFTLRQGSRAGTADDPFVILGLSVHITEHPQGMDHVLLEHLIFNGESIPYQPFGFEFKSGYDRPATFIPIRRKPYMGQNGQAYFTMTGMQHGTPIPRWRHTEPFQYSFEYEDGSTEWRVPKRKETLLNSTLLALQGQSTNANPCPITVDHGRSRKSLYIQDVYTDAGYPVRVSVPKTFLVGLQQERLAVDLPIQWKPGSAAEKRARYNPFVWGRERPYWYSTWEDLVLRVRDGIFPHYDWNPVGKMEVLSVSNWTRLRNATLYWDETYGKLFRRR